VVVVVAATKRRTRRRRWRGKRCRGKVDRRVKGVGGETCSFRHILPNLELLPT